MQHTGSIEKKKAEQPPRFHDFSVHFHKSIHQSRRMLLRNSTTLNEKQNHQIYDYSIFQVLHLITLNKSSQYLSEEVDNAI